MKRRRRPLVVLLGVVVVYLVLLAGCAILERMYTVYDTFGPPRLDGGSIVGIVDAIVVEPTPVVVEGTQSFAFRAKGVRYERGPYPIRGSDEQVHFAVPAEGTTFEAIVDRGIELSAGSKVTLVLEAWAIEDVSVFEGHRWHARLIVDGDGEPVPGTPESLAADLATIRGPDGDPVEALVALATDLEAYGRAVWAAGRENAEAAGDPYATADGITLETIPMGATLERLRRAETPDGRITLDAWLGRSDDLRQLPMTELDLTEFTPEARTGLGIDEWVRWVIIVTYDPAATAEVAYVGALLPGHGFFGPVALDSLGLVTVHGFGPPDASMELLVWEEGLPAETILGFEEQFGDRKISHAERLPLPGGTGSGPSWGEVPPSGAIHVVLEGKRVTSVELLDGTEVVELVERFGPGSSLATGGD